MNDQYSAPITREVQEFLQQRLTEQRERFSRFFNSRLDSIELNGLADELDWLSESFRAAADKANRQHIGGYRMRTVVARPIDSMIHHADGNVAGRYTYWAETDEAALDQFHETVPVKMLEDWDFTVEVST